MPHVSLACRHHAGTRPDRSAGRTALQLRQPEAETRLELVYDTEPPHPAGTMAFFRHSNQASELPPDIDTRGLESLQLPGSERITSVEQVRAIRQACGDAPLVVVDLRQESHAVADGHSLTWRGPMDWGNVGLGTAAATAREAEQLEELRRQGNAVATHADHVKGKSDEPALRRLDTALARSEQEIVEAAGADYRRIAVTDHLRPSRGEVDQFIDLARGLPDGAGLHVHCNGGRGRTTTFMVLYDMPRNAREAGADAIMARQSRLGMDYNRCAYRPADACGFQVKFSERTLAVVRTSWRSPINPLIPRVSPIDCS